ncbi:MAG: glycosyltransferase family 4 protein [Nitrososphaerota archaeon]|nr:glycosyltransferase family 4 protein [Nitrososphaerota archaeon]
MTTRTDMRLMKPSVLFITGRLAPWITGGANRLEYNLVRWVASDRLVELTLLGTVPPSPKNPLSDYPSNVTVCAVKSSTAADSFGDIAISNVVYPLAVSRQRYDIVHFNILPGLRTLSLMWMLHSQKNRIKRVVNIHGYPGEVRLYSDSIAEQMVSNIHWKTASLFLNSFDAVVVHSNSMKKIVNEIGIETKRILFIPNGIPDELSLAARSTTISDVVLCVGNLYPIKGQDLLIRAFARSSISKTHKLVFVGEGNPAFKNQCKILASVMGVNDKVSFSGFLSQDELREKILSSKVCVFPSRFEPAGSAILEAMSLRKAIIATMKGGPTDYIEDGEEGCLVDPAETEQFAELLDKVCTERGLRERLGNNAAIKSRQYSWSQITKKYEQLYLSLVGASAGT